MREITLSHINNVLADLEYPVTNEQAAADLEDVTLLLADGQRNLSTLIEQSESDRFESTDDLVTELHNVLPREAVGEPYQSEGEG
ncbi:DUF5789 family protein [Natrinema halophilum]|uniref:DUF2795 domain-containing protein n=1 Tax=Natrinema halophilum TaxID=1699371 RepID=A0A7D5GIY6_9EURY|nr:hypothetical protein [Natrinema halophilum]QLG50268.1 hypothetical protein HYG82_16160 [Natrinema halophilum]